MFAGFVITGEATQRVLIRGIGPTLTGFGVEGALADPILRLRQESELVASNQDWSASGNTAEIISTTLTVGGFPLDSRSDDAVLLVDLAPGLYTVELSGVDGGTGVGLVEVYRVP